MKYDGLIDIAIGRSRKEVNWKNTEVSWSDFCERLKTTHRTAETLAEYMTAKKPRQDEIKDIGGFVGGYLSKGRRKTGNVAHRSMITLDLDFAKPDSWADFCMLYDCAAVVYSTHKHSPSHPRLRLIIPLDREVFSDEYVPIARRIAGVIGIEQFDHTGFEPSRLMYWPSTAKDAEYVYEVQDGPWLSADSVLATYRDWRDSSEWPMGKAYEEAINRGIKKQGDPLEKTGIVGAFCRTHSISEAIDRYLGDSYEASDMENRYTFKHGSTAAGLVVYDDKYAYSHHGTDPVSGKLCNAFDLVRIHLYGLRDEEAREGTPTTKLPSYGAMCDKAMEDPAVRVQIGEERLAKAKTDFTVDKSGKLTGESLDDLSEDDEDGEEADNSWMAGLKVDRSGNYLKTINNCILILKNDPRLKGKFSSNAFTRKDMVLGHLPWRKLEGDTSYFTDVDMMGLRDYIEKVYNIAHPQKVSDAMNLVLYSCRYHPVRDYLEGLVWDGRERLDTLLIDYLGAEDTEYVRTVTRKTLVAAVARVMNPGVKFDYVLTLVGKQGAGKSTLIKKLGGPWYCENLTTVQGKEAAEQLQGVWLMEMGELAGLKKAEVEIIKNFISRQEDSYRPAYGTRKETYPRQCIFIGTTNNRDFLRDPTGNRRFWPVMLGVGDGEPDYGMDTEGYDIPEAVPAGMRGKDGGDSGRGEVLSVHDLDDDEIGQIWAEAVRRYKGGEKLYLSSEVEEMAREVQEEHQEVDDRTGAVIRYVNALLPEDWKSRTVLERRAFLAGDELEGEGTVKRMKVCVAEIWCECFGGTLRDMTNNNTKVIHQMLRNMPGWMATKSVLNFSIYGRQRAYYRDPFYDKKR